MQTANKQRNVILSLFLIPVLVALLFSSCTTQNSIRHNQIIEQCTDDRGLTSVVFTEGSDTFALDYLTAREFISFKNSVFNNRPFHFYETDDTEFYDGEILYPDYVHSDTLIVTDAKFINWAMEHYNAASDGDINDILISGTKKYAPYYIITCSNDTIPNR